MILQNIINRLELVKSVLNSDSTRTRLSQVAAFAVIAEYKDRIFTQGLTTDGTKIGRYSTVPFYQNPNSLIGVPKGGVSPLGKNGQSRFKNGKNKKTRYLPSGYAELRELTGRQSNTVDLNLSGSLSQSIQVVEDGGLFKVRYTIPEEAEKMEANERRFGVVISEPSEEEREAGIRAAAEELEFILNNL